MTAPNLSEHFEILGPAAQWNNGLFVIYFRFDGTIFDLKQSDTSRPAGDPRYEEPYSYLRVAEHCLLPGHDHIGRQAQPVWLGKYEIQTLHGTVEVKQAVQLLMAMRLSFHNGVSTGIAAKQAEIKEVLGI